MISAKELVLLRRALSGKARHLAKQGIWQSKAWQSKASV
jgi:hypothetical protein